MQHNRFPLFILTIIVLTFATSCTKVEKSYYPNGRLESKIGYRSGKEHGKTIYYNDYTQLPVLVVEMRKGKKEGKLYRYFPYGQLKSEENYVNDLLDGAETIYDAKGYPLSETHFVKGVKNGSYTTWHDRNMIKEKGSFKDDKFDGEWEYYDERGFMVGEGSFENGTGFITAYDQLGNLQRRTHYVDNMKEGDDVFYQPNGEVEKVVTYNQDRIVEINNESVSTEDLNEE